MDVKCRVFNSQDHVKLENIAVVSEVYRMYAKRQEQSFVRDKEQANKKRNAPCIPRVI
jgi:hypothetical protein